MKLCIECKEKPIFNKKRRLCKLCYGRLIKSEKDTSPTGESSTTVIKNRNVREVEFIKNYFNHKNWIHYPALFHIKNGKYSIDFYDGETNTFIEVAGTRQAYHMNKHKYELFRKTFPLIKFEIRTPDGELLQEDSNGRLIWNKEKA